MLRTPRCRTHHSTASATAVNILGAERRPNGSIASKNKSCFHRTARRRRSSGCTGTKRYADFTSTLASKAPFPYVWAACATLSTDVYWREHSCDEIPSLTLAPAGDERSVISLQRPGVLPLGMTPKRLTCASGNVPGGKGPKKCPSARSLAIYSSTTSGCCRAESIFSLAETNRCLSKPILNPCSIPFSMYSANLRSLCADRRNLHAWELRESGEEIGESRGSTR